MCRGKFMKPLETLREVLTEYDEWDAPIMEEVGQENVKMNEKTSIPSVLDYTGNNTI
jgi:hypothetical protein